MGNLELAAFCVRHAAELNAGLGNSPTQQAIVQTFLKNYDKVYTSCDKYYIKWHCGNSKVDLCLFCIYFSEI